MLLAVWIALGVSVVAAGAGVVSSVRAGLAFWRDFQRFSSTVTELLLRLSEHGAEFAERAATVAETRSVEVQRSVSSLGRSLARLNVLIAAVQDARAIVTGVTVLYPRK